MILLLTACGGDPEEQTETTPEPTTQAEQTTAPTTDKPEGSEGEKEPDAGFNTPMVPGNNPTSIGDLLTATNPEQRQEQVKQEIRQDSRDRANPFGAPQVNPPPQRSIDLNTGPEAVEKATKNLNPRAVPDLPELPVLALAPPPQPSRVRDLTTPQGTGGNPGSRGPATSARQGVGGNTGARGSTGGTGNTGARGSTGGTGNTGAKGSTPPAVPKKPQKPSIPSLQTRGVPDVPELPTPIGPEKLPPAPSAQPVASIPTSALTPQGVPDLPELPTPIGPEQLPPAPVAQAPQSPPIPPPPDTQLAEGIEVTGVIEVGSQVQIIAKAPNEATSRYIKVGQKIANGEVVVKRVDKEGGEPVVILEQNGVEVIKRVGEKVAIATDEEK
jgi:hypothetical protein